MASQTKSYSLYYSEQQKLQNEAEQARTNGGSNPSFSGTYFFSDTRTKDQYEATEFVEDTYLLGFICLRGRPTFRDAKLVRGKIPAKFFSRLRRVAK